MTVVAGGAALGSGAFSQVEADRTVSVNTAGDGSALLAFEVDTDYNGINDSDGNGDVVALTFDDINQDAVTTFEGALTVTNNGSEEVDFSVSDDSGNGILDVVTFEYDGGTDLSSTAATLAAGTSVDIDIVIDLTGNNTAPDTGALTFNAEATGSA